MEPIAIRKKFTEIGARVVINQVQPTRWSGSENSVRLDVRRDKHGEFFSLAATGESEISVVNTSRDLRHLLLMVKNNREKSKFLCGHDERHWFVAAIPEKIAGVTDVIKAMEALKPTAVLEKQAGMKTKSRISRRNSIYVRQGEWYFLSRQDLDFKETTFFPFHRNEPLLRGSGSKPHICELLVRRGGELVHVCRRIGLKFNDPRGQSLRDQLSAGLTSEEYAKFIKANPDAVRWEWTQLTRNPEVYVKGKVSHRDHTTITLPFWHQVLMNTEPQAKAMRHVAFLD